MSSKGYAKPEGSKEPKDVKEARSEKSEQTILHLDKALPNGYSKQEGTREPTLFIIISGGEKREKDYFSIITKKPTLFPRVRIEYNPDMPSGGHPPKKLFIFAQCIKKKYDESKGNDLKDYIYLITDVDDFIDEIKAIQPPCNNNNIKLIISNPCFEIWLYYGRFSGKPTDFKEPKNHLKIPSAFKTYLGQKVSGGVDPRKALYDIEKAAENAKNNYEEENNIPKRYATNMFELVDNLHPFIKVELDKVKKEAEKK